MKRWVFALIAALLLVAHGASAWAHTVEYYFLSYCESCDPAEDFSAQFNALTGINLENCDFDAYNAATAKGRAALEAAMAKYGLSDEVLPMAVVDGKVCQGCKRAERETSAGRPELGRRHLKPGGLPVYHRLRELRPGGSCAESAAPNRHGEAGRALLRIRS